MEAAAQRRAMQLSLIDVVFYGLMIGLGELFFVAAAVRLGATSIQQGLIATLPLCIGTLGPLLTLVALRHGVVRKTVVVVGAFGQSSILAIVASLAYQQALAPSTLIALVCGYQVCGQAFSTAWNSWYGDVVPADTRGLYFSRRSRIAHIVTCAALVGAGLLLNFFEPSGASEPVVSPQGRGFALIFALAAVARGISCGLVAASPEPSGGQVVTFRETRNFATSTAALPIRRLLLTAAGLQLLVYVSSPYFNPFQLQVLHFSWIEYMLSSIAVMVFKFLWLPAWGRAIDSYGARSVYRLALLLLSLIPLPWVWTDGIGWVIFAQCLSGFAWGGHEVANFALILESAKTQVRAQVFAAMNLVNGVFQLLGSLIGAAILSATNDNYRAVFAISIAGRLAVAAFVPQSIPSVDGRPTTRRRQIFFDMLGVRPSGGFESRPILVQEDDPKTTDDDESTPAEDQTKRQS